MYHKSDLIKIKGYDTRTLKITCAYRLSLNQSFLACDDSLTQQSNNIVCGNCAHPYKRQHINHKLFTSRLVTKNSINTTSLVSVSQKKLVAVGVGWMDTWYIVECRNGTKTKSYLEQLGH